MPPIVSPLAGKKNRRSTNKHRTKKKIGGMNAEINIQRRLRNKNKVVPYDLLVLIQGYTNDIESKILSKDKTNVEDTIVVQLNKLLLKIDRVNINFKAFILENNHMSDDEIMNNKQFNDFIKSATQIQDDFNQLKNDSNYSNFFVENIGHRFRY
uniref:Uncharacterized protein n=1 Tax=viral metagenome TaxID=1070528 RepID=A0A6C0KI46_9ZZZZ